MRGSLLIEKSCSCSILAVSQSFTETNKLHLCLQHSTNWTDPFFPNCLFCVVGCQIVRCQTLGFREDKLGRRRVLLESPSSNNLNLGPNEAPSPISPIPTRTGSRRQTLTHYYSITMCRFRQGLSTYSNNQGCRRFAFKLFPN